MGHNGQETQGILLQTLMLTPYSYSKGRGPFILIFYVPPYMVY